MQTDVCIRIINEKMNKKFLVRWVFDVPAIIAFGFNLSVKPPTSISWNLNVVVYLILVVVCTTFDHMESSHMWSDNSSSFVCHMF